MSLQQRQWVLAHPHTFFQAQSQRADLADENLTNTDLIVLVTDLLHKGHILEFTAIRSDHHDDTALNPTPPHTGTHGAGYAFDCWPLASAEAGDYLSASDPRFVQFCHDAGFDPVTLQEGLAGSAWTHAAVAAAGSGVFHDDGGDHIHIGVS